jgi:hypothetical protein
MGKGHKLFGFIFFIKNSKNNNRQGSKNDIIKLKNPSIIQKCSRKAGKHSKP